ncbi:PLC-like phosphodiesterase [Agrocybe pediades]|nr:PLC-like phosphodiesterase [Agrocybe pediades]
MHLSSFLRHSFAFVVASVAISAQAHPAVSESTPASRTINRRATVCNGHAELCNRSFGNVTFVGAHDSYAIGVNNLAVNQDQSITQQLNDGIRMLQMQAHNQSGVIRLCHTSCGLYDGGTLEDYLKTVKQWLDSNPNEVLSLLIVNIDNLPASAYGAVFKSAALDTVSYAPPTAIVPASGWPTLGDLIDSGKRLLTFLDNGADLSSVPYLIDEFTNVWESAFNVIDPAFDCNVNRTKGDPTSQMFLINHFLDQLVLGQPVPFISQLNVTNAASGPGSLGAQVATCVQDHGRAPNFLLVDFYEYGGGSVFQVAADINGVSYSPSKPIATPLPTSSTASGAGNSVSVTSTKLNGGGVSQIFINHLYTAVAVSGSMFLGAILVL